MFRLANGKVATSLAIVMLFAISAPLAQAITPPATAPAATASDDPTHGIRFDVVSIKLNKTGNYGSSDVFPDNGDGMILTNWTLEQILKFDYAIHRNPGMVGLPDWAGKDGYDIQAKVADSDVAAWRKLSGGSKRLVLRAMLADSFKFKVHSPKMGRKT
jgi:hypothetical protein